MHVLCESDPIETSGVRARCGVCISLSPKAYRPPLGYCVLANVLTASVCLAVCLAACLVGLQVWSVEKHSCLAA